MEKKNQKKNVDFCLRNRGSVCSCMIHTACYLHTVLHTRPGEQWPRMSRILLHLEVFWQCNASNEDTLHCFRFIIQQEKELKKKWGKQEEVNLKSRFLLGSSKKTLAPRTLNFAVSHLLTQQQCKFMEILFRARTEDSPSKHLVVLRVLMLKWCCATYTLAAAQNCIYTTRRSVWTGVYQRRSHTVHSTSLCWKYI